MRAIVGFGLVLTIMAVASLQAGPAGTVTILHKGKEISVSCNALSGHLKHADDAEEDSILKAQVICSGDPDPYTTL